MSLRLMVRKNKLPIQIFSLALVGLMTLYACNSADHELSSNSSVSGPSLIAFPPIVEDPFPEPEPETVGEFFAYSDPNTKQYIDSVTSSGVWFWTEMEHWEALGYEYAPEHSFIIEGDSAEFHYWSVSYALRYTPDTALGMGIIRQSLISDGSGVIAAPLEVIQIWFVDPVDTTYELIDVDTWYKSNPPTSIVPLNWSWGDWGKCTGIGSVAGCAGGAVGCIITGPGYAACAGGVCVGSIVTAVVGCALAQFFN